MYIDVAFGLGVTELHLYRLPNFANMFYDEQRRFLGLPDVGRVTECRDPSGMATYDKLGRPMSTEVWAQACANFDYRTVEKTDIDIHGETVRVSTVWLGLDHRFGAGPPVIFETMVFGEVDGHDMSDMMQERYCTEAAALEGHAMAVAACRRLGAIEPDPEQAELTE